MVSGVSGILVIKVVRVRMVSRSNEEVVGSDICEHKIPASIVLRKKCRRRKRTHKRAWQSRAETNNTNREPIANQLSKALPIEIKLCS